MREATPRLTLTLLSALTLFLILPSVQSITCEEANIYAVIDSGSEYVVNIQDLIMIANIFGLTSLDAGFNPDCDVNTDMTINVLDLALVSANMDCTISCPDGDHDFYGSPAAPSCPNPEQDCNDTDPGINPGADEVCELAGFDDNCDGESDFDDQDGMHGDTACPVSVTGISLSDSSPREGSSVYVSCGSSVPGIMSIAAYIGSLQCSYTSCADQSANFTCLLPDSSTVRITLYYNFSGPCEDTDWDSVAAYVGALQCSYTSCAGKSANFTCLLADGSDEPVNITLYYDFSGPCEDVDWDSLVDSFGSQCSFSNWIGSAANFTCNVGPAGQKAAACYIYTSRSYQSGSNQFATMTVFPSACSAHSDPTGCGLDPDCNWCPECSNNQWSGSSDRCIGTEDNCDYSCEAGVCGAECDFDTTGCADTCDDQDGCYGSQPQTYRDYSNEPNYCQSYCTCTDNPCSYAVTLVDSDSDGYDARCDDCNDDPLDHGADCYPGATETCDGYDNDCDTQTDEGCDDDNDDYCDDGMTTTGFPAVCPNGGGDCNDDDPGIYPNAPEACTNGIDDNCDSESDYDSSDGMHGDSQCPVSVTGISVSDTTPRQGNIITVSCTTPSSVAGVDSVDALIESSTESIGCYFTGWSGSAANFNCNVGFSTGQKTVKCYVDESSSFQSGVNQTATITVLSSSCSAYTDYGSCDPDPNCDWCLECSGNQYSGGPDRCVDNNNCVYNCDAGSICGATCDFDTTGCAPTECDYLDDCYGGTYGTWRDYHDEPNYCQAATCTCTSNSCWRYDELGPCGAPRFAKTVGGSNYDDSRSIQQTTDGGYILTGSTESFGAGNLDLLLVKFDSSGNVAWARTVGGSGNEVSNSIQQTSDGGYIATGHTWSFGAGNTDLFLVKFDSSGNVAWARTVGGSGFEEGRSVQQTSDGGYITFGKSNSFGSGYSDILLVKLDSSGNVAWARTISSSYIDYGWSVQQTTDGGYITFGQTESFGAGGADIFLVKFDSSGNVAWAKTIGGSSHDYGRSVQQTSDGGYIATGHMGDDLFILKLDGSGNVAWAKIVGGSNYDDGQSVQQTSDGGYIVTGSTENFGAGEYDLFLVKFDSSGNVAWAKTVGGSSHDYGRSVQQTSDGGYIATGGTYSFGAGDVDTFLVKLDSDGNIPGCGYVQDITISAQSRTISAQSQSISAQSRTFSAQSQSISAQSQNLAESGIC